MKRHYSLMLSCLLCLTVSLSSFNSPEPNVKKLAVESNHSTVLFSVPISNGITRITGKFTEFSIDIDLVDEDFEKSKIKAVILTQSIDTGIPGRDDHLRTIDFFDTERFPEITFTSENIIKTEDGFVAKGNFQLHGITKQLQIPFVVTGKDGENTIGLSSRLTIKRSDFNLGTEFQHTDMENFIGDEIGVEIDFWTKKRKEK